MRRLRFSGLYGRRPVHLLPLTTYHPLDSIGWMLEIDWKFCKSPIFRHKNSFKPLPGCRKTASLLLFLRSDRACRFLSWNEISFFLSKFYAHIYFTKKVLFRWSSVLVSCTTVRFEKTRILPQYRNKRMPDDASQALVLTSSPSIRTFLVAGLYENFIDSGSPVSAEHSMTLSSPWNLSESSDGAYVPWLGIVPSCRR